MKDFIKHLKDEQAVLSKLIWTWKYNEDYALHKIDQIENTLNLINEYETDRKESA